MKPTTLLRLTLSRIAVFSVLALGLFQASASCAATISNGSFEVPDVGGQTGVAPGFLTGTDGWEVTAGRITIFDNSSGAGPASDGNQFITLRDNGTSGTIEQVFATISGQEYTINWDEGYASRNDYNQFNPPSTATYTADVRNANDNSNLATSTRNVMADLSDPTFGVTFLPTSLSFVAASTSTVLRFTETANSSNFNSYASAIDNVSITAVPEPGSFALLALGMVAMWVHRRK